MVLQHTNKQQMSEGYALQGELLHLPFPYSVVVFTSLFETCSSKWNAPDKINKKKKKSIRALLKRQSAV